MSRTIAVCVSLLWASWGGFGLTAWLLCRHQSQGLDA